MTVGKILMIFYKRVLICFSSDFLTKFQRVRGRLFQFLFVDTAQNDIQSNIFLFNLISGIKQFCFPQTKRNYSYVIREWGGSDTFEIKYSCFILSSLSHWQPMKMSPYLFQMFFSCL